VDDSCGRPSDSLSWYMYVLLCRCALSCLTERRA
jgi:hypothetical protein